MPTYEYVCEKCGHPFEMIQPISARPLTTCPKELCAQERWGKGKVKRAISGGGGLLFKGSGFYITDYRSEKYKAAAKKDSATASASSGESKSSSDGSAKPPPAKSTPKPEKPAATKT
jgi:putative FmdB family regulatory protein